MEDIKKYIESGILELYVMGDLSAAEKLEVEKMAAKHPVIRKELAEIEKAMEGYAAANATEPAKDVRERILNSIIDYSEPATEKPGARIVPIQNLSNAAFYRTAFAASVVIILASWAALFVIYSQLQDSRGQIASLQGNNRQFANRVNYINKELQSNRTEIAVLRSPDFKFIKLQGTKNAPDASILVAFNPKKKEVMVDMESIKMPENDKDHQYQLWALVDGKPVDLGVFDMSTDSKGMVRMKEITTAQAFAVTLEPRGGSANPTMDQMMVMGAISI